MALKKRWLLAFAVMVAVAGLARPAPAQDSLTPEQRKQISEALLRAQAEQRKAQVERCLAQLAAPHDSSNKYVYMESLRALNLSAEEGVPVYLGLLDNPSDVVKQGAVYALGDYGPKAKGAVPRILELFKDPERKWYVAPEAARALGKIGPQTPQVVPALASRLQEVAIDDEVKSSAIESLGLMGPAARQAVAALAKYLDDPETLVQFKAYRALGLIEAAARPSLAQLRKTQALDWKTSDRGLATFMAIQEAGPQAAFAVPLLLNLFEKDPPAYVRCMAIETLGKAGGGDARAVKAMLDALASADALFAKLGGEALALIDPKNEPAVPLLADALRHAKQPVRHQAALALKEFGAAARPAPAALVEALGQADEGTDYFQIGAYLETLKAIGPGAREVAGAVAELLAERSPIYKGRESFDVHYLRAFLLVTLAEIGVPPSAKRFILDNLSNSEPGMVHDFAGAARAAAALGPDAREAVPFLMRALKPDFRDHRITFHRFFAEFSQSESYTSGRIEAIRALARIGPDAKEAVPLLSELANDEPVQSSRIPPYQDEARKALQAIRGK